ncbi:MAG TPA: S8 family serine peptidase, partial [Chitinophagaceae bacterium]|nr:S8 family serine peptidase [Chitinophagaceae bacterium]
MKNLNKQLSFVLLLIFLISSGFSKQKTFYYSNNTKVELDIDTNILVFKSKTLTNVEIIKNQFKNIAFIEQTKNEVIRLDATKELKNSKSEILIDLKKNKDTYSWFELKDGKNIIIPTGEIIFKPKNGVEYKSILSKLKLENKVEFKSINEYNYVMISTHEINSIFEIANNIYESGLVEFSHPNFWIPIELTTNDPLYNQQYYLKNTGQTGGTNGIDINVESAWCISTGNNIRVAVIDDGVEAHEDIAGRVAIGFTPRNNSGLGTPNISGSHGQACAGIIGASQNNSIGVSGVAPNCIIVPVNIFWDGFETTIDLANAINWAWNQGQADVLSNSWGYNTSSQTQPGFDVIISAINNARTLGRGGKGCLVVFSSGNALPFSTVYFPGNVNNVITVGAIDRSGNIWNYSCRGSEMDLVAPSGNVNNIGDVVTTDRMGNNGYTNTNYTSTFGGTSAACPQVAGIAALMLAANPNLTETQVRTKLQQTATDMGTVGFDNTFGYGRVNAINAVQSALNISINGSNSICNGSQTYSLVGLPTGATVIWSRTPTNTTTLVQANNVATLTKTGDGLVTLAATITYCGQTSYLIAKSINVGFPFTLWDANGCQYPEAAIAEDLDGSPCNTQCYTPSGNKWWCAQPVYNATNVTWQKMWSIPSTYNFWSGSWSGNSNNVSIMFKSPNQSVVLKTTISNPCGSIEQYYCFSSTNVLCSGNFRTADCKQYEVSLLKNTSRLSIHEKSEKCEGTNKT